MGTGNLRVPRINPSILGNLVKLTKRLLRMLIGSAGNKPAGQPPIFGPALWSGML